MNQNQSPNNLNSNNHIKSIDQIQIVTAIIQKLLINNE